MFYLTTTNKGPKGPKAGRRVRGDQDLSGAGCVGPGSEGPGVFVGTRVSGGRVPSGPGSERTGATNHFPEVSGISTKTFLWTKIPLQLLTFPTWSTERS